MDAIEDFLLESFPFVSVTSSRHLLQGENADVSRLFCHRHAFNNTAFSFGSSALRMISNSGHLYGSVFAVLLFHAWFAQASAEEANTYVHKSGVFSVNATSGNVEESEAEISFTHTMPIAGSITGWDSVSIVKPELSRGRSDSEVINQIIEETFESYYKKVRRRRRPELSIMESVETEVAGRRSWYAKVVYPRLPGTGLTIFDDRGKQVEADFVAHLHLVSIDGLEISQRNLPVKHLLVSSFRAEPFLSNEASDYKNFVDSLSILEASTFVTGKYTGRYGFSFSIPANHAAFGLPFTKDDVQTELIYVFPEGTDPEKLEDEKLYGETGVIRFEAIPRIREERTITIAVMQKLFTDRAEGRGEKFTVTQPELSMPAFQITTTQPVSMEQVCIEGRQLLYVITAGSDSQLLLHVTQSLKEIAAE